MDFTFIILMVCILVPQALCYWEWSDDPMADKRCSGNIPSYMNWREGIYDFRETRHMYRLVRDTKYGPIEGISVRGVYDTSSYVNLFLGIPYAKPPINEDRFKPAKQPNLWENTLDVTCYMPACPQIEDWIQEDIPGFNYTNEDCLYINVFQPNNTDKQYEFKKYPVMVFIHGGSFKKGSSIQYPGIVLAQRDMVVVTFNYRLGPLGFLSLGDSRLPGNMGLTDQEMALKWVKENIWRFNGIPEEITLVGHEAGAASVGIHMLSPITKDYFKRAIMMSGSDLSPWAIVKDKWHIQKYAVTLSKLLGCGADLGESMLRCMRTKTPVEIVEAAEKVPLGKYETAGPFVPVVDSYSDYIGWLRDTPEKLRENPNNIKSTDLMAGFTKDDGANILSNNFSRIFSNIDVGVSLDEFRNVTMSVSSRRGARDENQVQQAIEFLYTWWVNPDNSTARRKMLIDVFTDELYASGVDLIVKNQIKATHNTDKSVYMYKFDYRSEKDNPSTYWMGAYHKYDIKYLLGYPFIAQNNSYQYLTSIRLENNYTELDRNMSNATMQLWKEFAKRGTPNQFPENSTLPWNLLNVTWYPTTLNNLTYFELDYNSTNEKEYHQSQLAFWQDYIYNILDMEQFTTTQFITTRWPYEDYRAATYGLGAILAVALLILIPIAVVLCRYRSDEKPQDFMNMREF